MFNYSTLVALPHTYQDKRGKCKRNGIGVIRTITVWVHIYMYDVYKE